MKNLLISILAVATLGSCISSQARDEALMPAVMLAWGNSLQGVRADVERGIGDAVLDGDLISTTELDALVNELDAALRLGGSRVLLRTIPWEPQLRLMAERGIQDRVDDGEISQMIADQSYMERLRLFNEAFAELLVTAISTTLRSERAYPSLPGIGPTQDHAAIVLSNHRCD